MSGKGILEEKTWEIKVFPCDRKCTVMAMYIHTSTEVHSRSCERLVN